MAPLVLPATVHDIVFDDDYAYGVGSHGRVWRADFTKPGVVGTWSLVHCNDAGSVSADISHSVSWSVEKSASLSLTIGTEIEAGVL